MHFNFKQKTPEIVLSLDMLTTLNKYSGLAETVKRRVLERRGPRDGSPVL